MEPLDRCDACRSTRPGTAPGSPDAAEDAAVLDLRATVAELPRLAAWIEAEAVARGASPALAARLNLAVEEWVVNVMLHAFDDPAAGHAVEVRLWRAQDELRATVADDGRPFDPTVAAEADTSLPLGQRPLGGLGIHLIRRTMDGFAYRREEGHNIVTFVKRLSPEPADGRPGENPTPC